MKIFLLVFGFVILIASQLFARELCFQISPTSQINDKTCAPVKVNIAILDCKTSEKTESTTANAKFVCKGNPPELKYWFKDAMLVAELEKTKKGYEIKKQYALDYEDKKHPQVITPIVAALPAKEAASTLPEKTAEKANEKSGEKVSSTDLLSESGLALAEAKPGVTVSPMSSAAEPTPMVAPVVAEKPVQEVEKPTETSVKDVFNSVKVSGLVDVYYSYDSLTPQPKGATTAAYGAKPTKQITGLVYNFYHDQVVLNYARLSLYKEADPVGFHIDLGYGPQADEMSRTAAAASADASSRNLIQGYVSFKPFADLQLDAGKFYTPFGYEVPESFGNANYSHSYGFEFAIPVWHSGVRANYSKNGFAMGAYYVNGWNNMYDNNSSKTTIGSLGYTHEKVSIAANYIYGIESAIGNDIRTGTEGILTLTPAHWLKFAIDYQTTDEKISDVTKKISSTAIYLELKHGKWILAPRYEIFEDKDAISFGTAIAGGQTIGSTTVTIDYLPTDKAKIYFEYRTDMSDKYYFVDGNSNLTQQQNVATLGTAVNF